MCRTSSFRQNLRIAARNIENGRFLKVILLYNPLVFQFHEIFQKFAKAKLMVQNSANFHTGVEIIEIHSHAFLAKIS